MTLRRAIIFLVLLIMLALLCVAGQLVIDHSTAYWFGRLVGMGIGACICFLAVYW